MGIAQYQEEQLKLTIQCQLGNDVYNHTCLGTTRWFVDGGVHGGLYAIHLKHWLSFFRPEQFILIPLTAYKKHPIKAVKAIASKLGLDSGKLRHKKNWAWTNVDPNRITGKAGATGGEQNDMET